MAPAGVVIVILIFSFRDTYNGRRWQLYIIIISTRRPRLGFYRLPHMQEPLSAAPCTSCARLVGLSHPTPNDPKNQTTHPGNLFGARRSILILGSRKPTAPDNKVTGYISKKPRPSPFKNGNLGYTYLFNWWFSPDFWNHHQPKRENPEKNDDFSLRWGFPGDRMSTKMLQKMAGIPPIGEFFFCETARNTSFNQQQHLEIPCRFKTSSTIGIWDKYIGFPPALLRLPSYISLPKQNLGSKV